uniref:Phospholipase A2 n=1 Tax=Panagrolaimus sp. PS1159 TaxID=55785 RepID=A0AC35G1A7_9BILA
MMLFAATFLAFIPIVFSTSDLSADVVVAASGLSHCGGGPWTSFFANLVSIPCDHSNIDNCCYEHDRCYESPFMSQQQCDSKFCACLESFPSSFYCGALAQKGLCLATQVFGHNFHWSSQCTNQGNNSGDEEDGENSTALKGNCILSGSLDEYEYEHILAI